MILCKLLSSPFKHWSITSLEISTLFSIRDIKIVTSNLINNNNTDNSTAKFNNEPSSSTVKLIVGVSFGVAGAIIIGFYCFKFVYCPEAGRIESNC